MLPRVRSGVARTLVVGALGSLIATGSAQQPAPAADFRTNVNFVDVDVRVFDRGGQFVTGLTREDFRVLENGRPQEVATLKLVDISTDSTSAGATPADGAKRLF